VGCGDNRMNLLRISSGIFASLRVLVLMVTQLHTRKR
jgi:hypothetical protein